MTAAGFASLAVELDRADKTREIYVRSKLGELAVTYTCMHSVNLRMCVRTYVRTYVRMFKRTSPSSSPAIQEGRILSGCSYYSSLDL